MNTGKIYSLEYLLLDIITETNPTINNIRVFVRIALVNIFVLFALISEEYLNTASNIFIDTIGISNANVLLIKSNSPYSTVVNSMV
jgi:hypothetical protein